MKHRYLIIGLFAIFICISCTQETSTTQPLEKEKMEKVGLIHTVYFYIKEGVTEEQKKQFEKGLVKLGTVPGILSYYWGPPAKTPKRDVIDDSYAYAINVHFKSLAEQDAYQIHPDHLEFIKLYEDLWADVKVYDNVVK